MDAFEMPLEAGDAGRLRLVVRTSPSGKVFGGPEPWYDISVVSDDRLVEGAVATQPLSCLVAVTEGRRTAMMCQAGVLAIQKEGERVRVDYHTMAGTRLSTFGQAWLYQSLVDSLGRAS